jgi:hypothetical protein
MSVRTAHLFESKDRTDDVKTEEEIAFSNLHLSSPVLEGQ